MAAEHVTPLSKRDPKEGLMTIHEPEPPIKMHEWAEGMELPRWLSVFREPPRWWRRIGLTRFDQDSWPMPDAHDRLHVIGILEKEIYGEVLSSEVRDHLEGCWYDPRIMEWVLR